MVWSGMAVADRTFRRAGIMFISWMVLPGIAVALAGDLIVTAVSYPAFLGVCAVGFSLRSSVAVNTSL